MELQWSGVTRFHDWCADDRAIPRRMLRLAREAGVIGDVAWYSTDPDDQRREVGRDDGVLDRLLGRECRSTASIRFAVGGNTPHPWQANLLLSPFREDDGEVSGSSRLNLRFDSPAFTGLSGSDALIAAFREMHTPDDTEFAFIHPHPRWSQLSDVIDGEYGDPVTFSSMFAGVYWATFLGRGHLALFHLKRLRDLNAYSVEWSDSDGLFIRVSGDVADAVSLQSEQAMFRLTEAFRRAER